jgi:hypothetical protein
VLPPVEFAAALHERPEPRRHHPRLHGRPPTPVGDDGILTQSPDSGLVVPESPTATATRTQSLRTAHVPIHRRVASIRQPHPPV